MSATLRKRSCWQVVLTLTAALFLLVTQTGCGAFGLLAGPEPVTLRFVYLEGMADYTSLVEAYQKDHPNVTIELVPVTVTRNPVDDLLLRMEGADAIRMSVEGISTELEAAFLPLDGLISTDRGFPQADLFPGVLNGLKLGGKQVGLPAGLNPFVVYYSPTKLKIAGVEPPSPAWTMEDFVLTATALHDTTQRGDPRFMYGLCTRPDSPDPAILAYLFGGGIVDDPYQPTRPTLNSPANIDSLAWYASLKNDFGIVPEIRNAGEQYRLISGLSCGLWMDWMDRAVYMELSEDQAGMLPLPAYRAPFGVANLDGYFILNTSEHAEETYEWLRFLMEQEAAAGRLIPPLKTAMQSPEYAARVSPSVQAIAGSLPSQTIILGMELYRDQRFGRVLELFMQAAAQVTAGSMDPLTALNDAQFSAEESFR